MRLHLDVANKAANLGGSFELSVLVPLLSRIDECRAFSPDPIFWRFFFTVSPQSFD
jgi:hypothetical protein